MLGIEDILVGGEEGEEEEEEGMGQAWLGAEILCASRDVGKACGGLQTVLEGAEKMSLLPFLLTSR